MSLLLALVKMNFKLKVHANSSQEKIEKIQDGFEAWIKEKPIDGKANSAIIKLFKKLLGKRIKIISGLSSSRKIIEVTD